jgi:hypothetical protein
MTDDLSPEAVAAAKRENILGVGAQEFMLWRHGPITAAFFQYLEDQIKSARELAADYVESGSIKELGYAGGPSIDRLRGEIMLLRQLHGIELRAIHEFYGKEQPVEDQESEA